MKQLLKLTLFAALCAFATASFAQLSFGIKGGLNLASIRTNETELNPKTLTTFQVGAVLEFGITDHLALHSGLSLQGKGAKLEETILQQTLATTRSPMYLQIPLHILYKGSGFFVGAGPYIGFGVAGKAKNDFSGQSETNTLKFGDTVDDDWAPLDFGVGVQAGVKLGSFRVGAGYDLGLSNVLPKDKADASGNSYQNGVINIFGAYMF